MRVKPASAPAAIARQFQGGGRVVYFPWNLGEVFWEVLNFDHSILIENAIRWALGEPPRVEVKGQGVLDIATRRRRRQACRAPGQSHQSDDDEGADPRDHPCRRSRLVSVALAGQAPQALPSVFWFRRRRRSHAWSSGRIEIDVTEIAASEVVLIDFDCRPEC